MVNSPSFPVRIEALLRSHVILSLRQLRDELGGRGRSSLFRDLAHLDVIASYTHAGQYHALRVTAQFDVDGLWFIRGAGFSRFGTLKSTLTAIISEAETGMTHRELKGLLRIGVQNALTELVRSERVGREVLPDRVYVYLSPDEHKADDQLQRRLAIYEHGNAARSLPVESIRIEVFVELIRAAGVQVDETELGSRLRDRGVAIQDAEIAYLLAHYDIKKKPRTKS
jgi:hypothetical protein